MKIVFICGSLDPGHDGVGDYVRRLAAALLLQNHQAVVIALNDESVDEILSETQWADNIDVPVLRIAHKLREEQRVNYARNWIDNFKPDFISLQFVIFSFHPKGLPFSFIKRINSIGKNIKWHVMFHELWVGMPIHATKKHVIWGSIQRILIRLLIRRIRPRFVNTQTWLYQEHLAKIGVTAEILPLFSNVPYLGKYNSSNIEQLGSNEKSPPIILVVFGGIHPYSKIQVLANQIHHFETTSGVEIILQAVGRCGPELQKWILIWQEAGLKLEVLGEQSLDRISQVLSSASIGITTTALPMIQKSGSVAAMREHGLPVICISDSWQPRGITIQEPPAGIFTLQEGIFEKCLEFKAADKSSFINCLKVSQLFIEELQRSK